jgi:hypothetical protein
MAARTAHNAVPGPQHETTVLVSIRRFDHPDVQHSNEDVHGIGYDRAVKQGIIPVAQVNGPGDVVVGTPGCKEVESVAEVYNDVANLDT